MGVSLADMKARLPAEAQRRVEERAQGLVAEEQTLRQVREAMNRTQTDVARQLGIGQDGTSRLERRTDMLLSTAREYIEAMGGTLQLVATFPNRPPVAILSLGDLDTDDDSAKSR